MNILGCWYSHNGIHPKILNSSLASVARARNAAETCDVQIRTCTWHELENNPFPGYLTFFRVAAHLGIVMQILKILYEEERRGASYDAVAFLEHDVLYPHDYFDRIAIALSQNPARSGVSNLDYIGMNETGWLEVHTRHEPMHQLSLRYDVAYKHFETVLKKCITDGVELLEPHEKSIFVRLPYVGDKPSCHINHSRHFTSHFAIYATSSGGMVEHPYWGNYRRFYPSEESSIH